MENIYPIELLTKLNRVLKGINWWPKDNLAKEIISCKVAYKNDIGTDQYNMDFAFICEKGDGDYLNCQIVTDHDGHYILFYEKYHIHVSFSLEDLITLGFDNPTLKTNYATSSAVKYPIDKPWYSMNKERWVQDTMPGSVKKG